MSRRSRPSRPTPKFETGVIGPLVLLGQWVSQEMALAHHHHHAFVLERCTSTGDDARQTADESKNFPEQAHGIIPQKRLVPIDRSWTCNLHRTRNRSGPISPRAQSVTKMLPGASRKQALEIGFAHRQRQLAQIVAVVRHADGGDSERAGADHLLRRPVQRSRRVSPGNERLFRQLDLGPRYGLSRRSRPASGLPMLITPR